MQLSRSASLPTITDTDWPQKEWNLWEDTHTTFYKAELNRSRLSYWGWIDKEKLEK